MRGISLRSGASICGHRSAPLLTLSNTFQSARWGYNGIRAREAKPLDSTRLFHVRSRDAGLARNIFSNFIGDDDETNVEAAAAAAARAEHEAYIGELDQADWIHPDFRFILEEGHPDRVLHALQHPQWGPDFITQAPQSLFHQTLKIISPHHFLKPYTANHFLFDQHRPPKIQDPSYIRGQRRRQNYDETTMGSFRMYSNLQVRFDDFSTRITKLLSARQHAGHHFTLETYVYLLDLARIMGDWELADTFFHNMQKSQIQADERCYNYYMEAKVWAGSFDYWESRRRGTTERMLAIRHSPERPVGFVAYRVGEEGLRMDMIRTLDEMVSHGYEGSEATFSHIITAMGREADLEGLKSVLKSVWNIDVDLLQVMDEEELETPTYYQRSSHLRPTSRLLFAVAHACSINHEPLMGLKIVDYISRQYDLRIPYEVWVEILTGIFLRCIPPRERRKSHLDPGLLKGSLPPSAFEDVWAIMIDQPHNVKPNAIMHGLRTDVFRHNLKRDQTFESLAATEAVLNQSRLDAYDAIEKFLEASESLTHAPKLKDASYILPASWFDLRNELCQTQVQLEAAFHRLLFLASRSLEERNFPGSRRAYIWEREILPNLMKKFQGILPNELEVKMSSGTAAFNLIRERNEAVRLSIGQIHAAIGLIRLGFDHHDHAKLVQSLYDVVRHRTAMRPHCERCGSYGHVALACSHEQEAEPFEKIRQDAHANRMRRRLLKFRIQDNLASSGGRLLVPSSINT